MEIKASFDSSKIEFIKMMGKAKEKSEKETTVFYFNDSLAHVEKRPKKPENPYARSWHLIHIKEMKRQIVNLFKSGEEKKCWSDYVNINGDTTFEKRNYILPSDTSARKNILGYDCFSMKVIESRKNIGTGEIEEWIYEMWVTDKIAFPAYIFLNFWKPITPLTVLECRQFQPNAGFDFYVIYRAIKITEQDVSENLKMPDWAKD